MEGLIFIGLAVFGSLLGVYVIGVILKGDWNV